MTATKFVLVPLAAMVILPLYVQAETPEKNDTIIVNASTIESTKVNELADYGNKLHVITRDEIERSGPSSDLNQVLQQYVPGLYVSMGQGAFGYGKYSFMGGRPDDTLILIDGVRLNNRLFGGIYLDTLPLVAIDRIEILQGAQSLSFGTQAISGVINIVTKKPTSETLTGEFNVGADTDKGRSGEGYVQKAFDNDIGKTGLMAWVSRHKSEGYQPYRDRDYNGKIGDKKRGYDLTSVGAQVTQVFADKAQLQAFYQYTDADLDMVTPNNHRSAVNKRDHHLGTLSFEHFLTADTSYSLRAHMNDWNTRYDRSRYLADGSVEVQNDDSYWGFRDYGIQAQLKSYLFGENEFVLGSDNQWYKGKDEVMKIETDTAKANALYLQVRPAITSLPELKPSLGVRYERFEGGQDATVWMASTAYEASDNLTLRGQVGTAFKLPNAEQLFVSDADKQVVGDPDLKAEKSKNIEAGFDYLTQWENGGAWQFGATGYAREINDLITTVKVGKVDRWVNGDGEIRTKGVVLATKLNFSEEWYVSADMTRNWLDTKNGATLNDIPDFFTRGRVGYDAPAKQWGAELSTRYVGELKSGGVSYGHYTVFDAGAYLYADHAQQHKFSLLVENLLNRDYPAGLTSNGLVKVDNLGRPLTAELRYTYRF
ncbi:MAG: TonB-dependent receptor [Morganella sp. (in: enterobacteria)]